MTRLEERLDDTIVALGYVRDRGDSNGEDHRSLREDVASIRREQAETTIAVGAMMRELGEVRRLLGRWPASPDDTGSGIAGRVALVSHQDLDEHRVPPSDVPPKALVALWKKHKRLGALVVFLISAIWAAIQSGALKVGEP